MADWKIRSIRADDETLEKFKVLSESFANQGEALAALIGAWEIQQAKTVITERASDISDFDSHIQAAQAAYLHALELNENVEGRIRQEFRVMLESKDKTIADLQVQLEQARSEVQAAQDKAAVAEAATAAVQAKFDTEAKTRQTAERSAAAAQATTEDKEKIIEGLTRQLAAVEGAEARIAAAEAKAQAAQDEAIEAKAAVSAANAEIARAQAEAELVASKTAVEMQVAILNARQEGQDRIGQLMEENHRLIQELSEMKAENYRLIQELSEAKAEKRNRNGGEQN